MSKQEENKSADDLAHDILMAQVEPEMDEDDYAVGDPYAEAAKLIDRKKKAADKIKDSTAGKIAGVAKSIIENKDQVSYWEKIVKTCLILGVLGYMVLTSEDLKEKKSENFNAFKQVLSAFTNSYIYTDFMSREGIILIVVVGGYLLANKYNRILDELDEEIAQKEKERLKKEKQEKKEARAKNGGEKQEDSDESSDKSSGEEESEEELNEDDKDSDGNEKMD